MGGVAVGAGEPVFIDPLTGQLFYTPIVPSSKQFKHNINNMADESEIIYKLRPVTFNYNDDNNGHVLQQDLYDENGNAIKQFGLIAEEVYEVIPSFVKNNYRDKTSIFTVDYAKLTPLLLNEIQKMNKKVSDLTDDNKKMGEIIKDLIIRIQSLEAKA